jgi:hypothetical protein
MTCLLCNEPFEGKKITTLGCGHKFHGVCLRQDLYDRDENLDECVCPLCLKPYMDSLLISEDLPPNSQIQRIRIFKINEMVIQKAYDLDEQYGRKNKEIPSIPTKESMDEARLMAKQRLKQQARQQKQEQEALIREQEALIREQQIENEVLTRQQIESEAFIQQQEERIQERERELERRYNNLQKGKGKGNRLFF